MKHVFIFFATPEFIYSYIKPNKRGRFILGSSRFYGIRGERNVLFWFALGMRCEKLTWSVVNIKNNNFATWEFFSISPGQLSVHIFSSSCIRILPTTMQLTPRRVVDFLVKHVQLTLLHPNITLPVIYNNLPTTTNIILFLTNLSFIFKQLTFTITWILKQLTLPIINKYTE